MSKTADTERENGRNDGADTATDNRTADGSEHGGPSGPEAPREPAGRRSWLALAALCTGFFMILLDTTIVNIAIPAMVGELSAGLDDIIWVNSIYLLGFAVPLLITGRLGDRFGPKRIYLAGLVLFTVASLACGLAGSIAPLVVARALQGLGAAAMMPQTMAFIYHLFPAGRRGAAMGLWGAVAGVATVSGPLLGGVIVDALGWAWVFFINIPIGLFGLVAVQRLVPDWQPRHSHHFDPLGIALFSIGLGAAIFGLQEGERYDWGTVVGPVTVWTLMVGGIVLLGLFVLWQRRTRGEPLLPLGLFAYRSFSLSIVANAALGFTVIGNILPLMLYLQTVREYSPLAAGALSAPMALASGCTSAFVGRIAERVDARKLAAFGFFGCAAGLAALAYTIRTDVAPWLLVPPLLLAGIGMGSTFAPLATLGTLSLPSHLVGSGSGLFNTLRQVGSAVGSAAVGVLLQARLSTELGAHAREQAGSLPDQAADPFVRELTASADRFSGAAEASGGAGGTSFELPPSVPETVADQIRAAAETAFLNGFTDAVRGTLLLPAGVLLLGVIACLLMPHPHRRAERSG